MFWSDLFGTSFAKPALLKGTLSTQGCTRTEYMQCALVCLQHPSIAARFRDGLAGRLPVSHLVASPHIGGLIIGQ